MYMETKKNVENNPAEGSRVVRSEGARLRGRTGQIECPVFHHGTRFRNVLGGRDGKGSADGHVDEEDPSPGREVGDDAAQQEADCASAGGDTAPDGQRRGALLRIAEARRD